MRSFMHFFGIQKGHAPTKTPNKFMPARHAEDLYKRLWCVHEVERALKAVVLACVLFSMPSPFFPGILLFRKPSKNPEETAGV